MATEKRLDLISRRDLIKAVESKHFAISDNTHPYEAIRIQGKYFREVVDNAPQVDAVEVVRCKDCQHYDNSEGIQWCKLNSKFYPGGFDWHSFPEDGFCSYGERRTDGRKEKNDTIV